MTLALVAIVGASTAGCKGLWPFGSNPGELPDNDSLAYHAMEDRLARARRIAIEAQVKTEGAIASAFEAKVVIDRPGSSSVELHGTFMGRPANVLFEARHGGASLNGNELGPAAAPRPGVDDSLVLGLMRMGLTHNMAVLIGGQPPDHADGTAQELAAVGPFHPMGRIHVDGKVRRGLSFDVSVNGKPMGDAVLWVDVASGLPVERKVTVHFPQGDLKVVERYTSFVVDPG